MKYQPYQHISQKPYAENRFNIIDQLSKSKIESNSYDLSSYTHTPSILNHQDEESLLNQDIEINKKVTKQDRFNQMKDYCKSQVANWGLEISEMIFNKENQKNLNCIYELVNLHNKDLQIRSKLKDQISNITYQKQRYRNILEQSQKNLQQTQRKLGRIQNQFLQFKNKIKKQEIVIKKQKQQDRKMIAALRAKNQQILHEVKKKEQQVARVKQQMKKSVGQKYGLAKNSFQVFENFSKANIIQNSQQAKYMYLMQRNERETSRLNQQNLILKQKIFDIRQILFQLSKWIDKNLYGLKQQNNRTQIFLINHNLMFKKETLVNQLYQITQQVKDGIIQLRDMIRSGRQRDLTNDLSPMRKPIKSQYSKAKLQSQYNKGKVQSGTKAVQKQKILAQSTKLQKNTQKIQKVMQQKKTIDNIPKVKLQEKKLEQIKIKPPQISRVSLTPQEPFIDELLSDVGSGQENSLMSNLDISKFGSGKLDKWDILYHEDS